MMVMLSQGEPGTRGSSGIPGRFGPGGNTGVAGAKGQKGFPGQTVSNTVVVVQWLSLICPPSYQNFNFI